jgi:tetratricopeptide (TPR) repeat protein
VPPALDLEGFDPVVARTIEAERDKILQSPRSAAAWGKLGSRLAAFNYRPEALICLAQAERLDPNEPRWPYHQGVLLLLDNPNEAIPKLRRAAELCGDGNLAPRLRLSEAFLSLRRLDEAEEEFRQVRPRDPSNSRASLGLGRIAMQRRQWPEAKSYLEAAATDRYSAREATIALAELQQQLGDNETANQLYLRVERFPPTERWPDPFIEELQRLHIGKRIRLIQADQLFKQGHVPEAIAQLDELAKDYADAPEVWFGLGQALHWGRAYPAAEQAMRKVIELTPRYPEAHNYLGAAQLRQGKLADAETALRKAIELKPDFALAYINLGRCLDQQKKTVEAVKAFRDAIRCKPDYTAAYVELAKLLHRDHRDAEALDEIRQALQLNPGDQEAKKLQKELEAK